MAHASPNMNTCEGEITRRATSNPRSDCTVFGEGRGGRLGECERERECECEEEEEGEEAVVSWVLRSDHAGLYATDDAADDARDDARALLALLVLLLFMVIFMLLLVDESEPSSLSRSSEMM